MSIQVGLSFAYPGLSGWPRNGMNVEFHGSAFLLIHVQLHEFRLGVQVKRVTYQVTPRNSQGLNSLINSGGTDGLYFHLPLRTK